MTVLSLTTLKTFKIFAFKIDSIKCCFVVVCLVAAVFSEEVTTW